MHSIREAARLIIDLAQRVRQLPQSEDIPECIRRQRWSALNTSLMCAAASDTQNHSILEWVSLVTQDAGQQSGYMQTAVIIGESTLAGWKARRS